MEGIPWLTQILNRIGKNDDAAAMNTTLFAGQQKIADDIAALPTTAQVNAEVDAALNTAIPGSPTAGSVNDVLKDLDARLPGSGTLSTLAAGDVPLTVPSADSTDNVYERDVLGNKTDAAVTTVGTTKSAMAYLKGLVDNMLVHSVQEYLSGSGNWTVPTGWRIAEVVCVGGGAGGNAGTGSEGGNGGPGGEIVEDSCYPVTPGASIAYSVGAKGTGGVYGGASATSGGNTTFGNITAYGGTVGSGGGHFSVSNIAAGTRGVSTGGQQGASTYHGDRGVTIGVSRRRTGGGGGGKGANSTSYTGNGGDSIGIGGTRDYGGGGGGSWGNGGNAGASAAANSGAGGGGANGFSSNGGDGGDGYIRIRRVV